MDLRFARGDEHLDLQNPDFSAAVADIASAIRGIPKDDLASEEVKQHRRTVRTAWAAGIGLAVLAVAAVVAGVFAIGQRNDARDSQALAEQEATRANTEADRANTLADQEAEARTEAERLAEAETRARLLADENAQLARSQELAAASTSVLESDPELASLLSVLSIQLAPEEAPPESVRVLRKADRANLLQSRIEIEGEGFVSLTPDEESIIAFTTTEQSLEIVSYDRATGTVNWRTPVDPYFDVGVSSVLSPDGSYALGTGTHEDSETGVLLVLSLADGEILETFTEECPRIGWQESGSPFTPDGSVLAMTTGTAQCQHDPEQSWVSFRDTSTWQEVDRLDVPGYFEVVQFDEDDGHFLLTDIEGSVDRLELRSYPGMELIQTFAGYGDGQTALSASGELVAYTSSAGTRIHAADSGEFLGWVEGEGVFLLGTGLLFSPDGAFLLVMTEEGVLLADSSNGKQITRLGSNRGVIDGSFTQDGTSLVTTYLDQIEIWSLARDSSAVPLSVAELQAVWVNPNRLFDRSKLGMLVYAGTFPDDMITWLAVVAAPSADTLPALPAAAADQLPDGRFVIVEQTQTTDEESTSEAQPELIWGGLSIWDPMDGGLDRITECSIPAFSPEPHCADGELAFGFSNLGVVASIDGSMVAADSYIPGPCQAAIGLIRVWEVATKAEVATIETNGCEDVRLFGDGWLTTSEAVYDLSDGSRITELDAESLVSELTEDGRFAAFVEGGPQRTVVVMDTSTWEAVLRWDAHEARVRGMAISPGGDRLATTGTDGLIRIWDIGPFLSGASERVVPQLLDEIPIGIASDAYWISENSLGVLLRNGTWTVAELDPAVLATGVLDRLQRSFTVTECENYRIEPCPTLEELRGH